MIKRMNAHNTSQLDPKARTAHEPFYSLNLLLKPILFYLDTHYFNCCITTSIRCHCLITSRMNRNALCILLT